jgi:hypothetical protein
MVRVGFAVRDVARALPTDKPVRDPVTVRVFYGEGEAGSTIWAVLDFMDFSRPFIEAIQGAVCARLGLPADHVHIVTTHNHRASEVDRLDVMALAADTADAALLARGNAQPATVRFACVDLTEQITCHRRLLVEELGGSATFWFGITAAERFSAERLLRQAVRSLVLKREVAYCNPGLSQAVPEESFIDDRIRRNPDAFRLAGGDPRLQVVVFESPGGQCLGAFVRFAVHIATIAAKTFYSSDLPNFVRRGIERGLGGPVIFLNGPAGDIAPAVPDERSQAGEPLSAVLVSAALAAIGTAPAAPLQGLADASAAVALPVDPEFPLDDAAAAARIAALAREWETPGLDLPGRRRLAEKIAWLRTSQAVRDKWHCIDGTAGTADGRRQTLVSLGLLRLNDITLLAFPGETFWETGRAVAATAGDAARIITVTEHGRTAMYLPPPEEWDRGGYETTCRGIARDGETVLRRAAIAFLQASNAPAALAAARPGMPARAG